MHRAGKVKRELFAMALIIFAEIVNLIVFWGCEYSSEYYPIKRQNYHHIETSQLICRANQLTGFYMMATLAVNELMIIYSLPWRNR